MQLATKTAFLDAVADLADDLIPGSPVRSYLFVWDDPLGFAFDVKPEDRASMVARLRHLADAIENET